MITCNKTKPIEIYLLASAYASKLELGANKSPMKSPKTKRYLRQKKPSFMHIEGRHLQSINKKSKPKRLRKLMLIRNTADDPMHSN